MRIALVIPIALVLNMAGAIVSKYVAMNLGLNVAFVALFALLLVIFAFRILFWIAVGRRWQLSYVYPVLSVNYLLSFLLGMLLFQEAFRLNRCVGALIIVAGVLIVSLSEHKSEGLVG